MHLSHPHLAKQGKKQAVRKLVWDLGVNRGTIETKLRSDQDDSLSEESEDRGF